MNKKKQDNPTQADIAFPKTRRRMLTMMKRLMRQIHDAHPLKQRGIAVLMVVALASPLCAAEANVNATAAGAKTDERVPFAPAGKWRVSLEPFPQMYTQLLVIDNGESRVRFTARAAWTIWDMHWRSREVGQPSGATGTVIQWERNAPAVTAADIPDGARLRQFPAAPPSLAAKLNRLLPAEAAAGKGVTEKELDAINAALRDPQLFEDAFLDTLPGLDKAPHIKAYAKRELEALRALGKDAAPEQVAVHNRRLLDWALAGRVLELMQTIGTGHGGEVVSEVTLEIDGEAVPVVAGGKLVLDPAATREGSRILLRKRSVIGPFDHEARFAFAPGEPGLDITHRFQANADMAKGHFAGYCYTFMFMMPPAYDRYLVVNPDGAVEQAVIEPKSASILNRPFKALALYAPEQRTGMAYVYPQAYPGSNHINVRPGKDRKFRASLFAERYNVGDVTEFSVRVTPFEAAPEAWADAAAALGRAKGAGQ